MLDYGVKDIKILKGIETIRFHPDVTNNYLSSIHQYKNCEYKNGDKCNELKCIYSIMKLGNGVFFFYDR